jgi:hypothetical protein
MLRRTGFKRKEYQPARSAPLRPLARPVIRIRTSDLVVACPKENALQHAGYMGLVRGLPCIRCGRAPRSQFCHADEGKGIGIKTDCRRGWPGCATCHHMVGSTGTLGKNGRRQFELEAGAITRAAIVLMGAWPSNLPMYEEKTT